MEEVQATKVLLQAVQQQQQYELNAKAAREQLLSLEKERSLIQTELIKLEESRNKLIKEKESKPDTVRVILDATDKITARKAEISNKRAALQANITKLKKELELATEEFASLDETKDQVIFQLNTVLEKSKKDEQEMRSILEELAKADKRLDETKERVRTIAGKMQSVQQEEDSNRKRYEEVKTKNKEWLSKINELYLILGGVVQSVTPSRVPDLDSNTNGSLEGASEKASLSSANGNSESQMALNHAQASMQAYRPAPPSGPPPSGPASQPAKPAKPSVTIDPIPVIAAISNQGMTTPKSSEKVQSGTPTEGARAFFSETRALTSYHQAEFPRTVNTWPEGHVIPSPVRDSHRSEAQSLMDSPAVGSTPHSHFGFFDSRGSKSSVPSLPSNALTSANEAYFARQLDLLDGEQEPQVAGGETTTTTSVPSTSEKDTKSDSNDGITLKDELSNPSKSSEQPRKKHKTSRTKSIFLDDGPSDKEDEEDEEEEEESEEEEEEEEPEPKPSNAQKKQTSPRDSKVSLGPGFARGETHVSNSFNSTTLVYQYKSIPDTSYDAIVAVTDPETMSFLREVAKHKKARVLNSGVLQPKVRLVGSIKTLVKKKNFEQNCLLCAYPLDANKPMVLCCPGKTPKGNPCSKILAHPSCGAYWAEAYPAYICEGHTK